MDIVMAEELEKKNRARMLKEFNKWMKDKMDATDGVASEATGYSFFVFEFLLDEYKTEIDDELIEDW